MPDPRSDARALLRAARAGTLATVADGQPGASLITPAHAPDGSLLMLLSGLSAHTAHLRTEPRCALLLPGEPNGPNPQAAPRLTVFGTAAPEPDPVLKARWVALHPYAAFYAGLGDFQLWRVRPTGGHFIGGFASATRLSAADLAWDPAAVAAIAAAAPEIVAHVNDDHPDTIALLAGPGWRMVAVDTDGADLATEDATHRLVWPTPVTDANGVRTALIRLARAARAELDAEPPIR